MSVYVALCANSTLSPQHTPTTARQQGMQAYTRVVCERFQSKLLHENWRHTEMHVTACKVKGT